MVDPPVDAQHHQGVVREVDAVCVRALEVHGERDRRWLRPDSDRGLAVSGRQPPGCQRAEGRQRGEPHHSGERCVRPDRNEEGVEREGGREGEEVEEQAVIVDVAAVLGSRHDCRGNQGDSHGDQQHPVAVLGRGSQARADPDGTEDGEAREGGNQGVGRQIVMTPSQRMVPRDLHGIEPHAAIAEPGAESGDETGKSHGGDGTEERCGAPSALDRHPQREDHDHRQQRLFAGDRQPRQPRRAR